MFSFKDYLENIKSARTTHIDISSNSIIESPRYPKVRLIVPNQTIRALLVYWQNPANRKSHAVAFFSQGAPTIRPFSENEILEILMAAEKSPENSELRLCFKSSPTPALFDALAAVRKSKGERLLLESMTVTNEMLDGHDALQKQIDFLKLQQWALIAQPIPDENELSHDSDSKTSSDGDKEDAELYAEAQSVHKPAKRWFSWR